MDAIGHRKAVTDDRLFVNSDTRLDKKTFIHVHEVAAGPKKGVCLAEPTLLLGETKKEFVGMGSTIDEVNGLLA